MKITKCENRFEVVVDVLTPDELDSVLVEFQQWLFPKELPSDEDYLAALGPCGK
jgi:hypothetical protein